MAVTYHDRTLVVHGDGVSYCGGYPHIELSFRIYFDRTGDVGNTKIVWHTENTTWTHPTSGGYGYHLYVYLQVDGGNPIPVLVKDNTTKNNWWNYVSVSNIGQNEFYTSNNTVTVNILVKGQDSCINNNTGKYCYRDLAFTNIGSYELELPTFEEHYTVQYAANGGDSTKLPANQEKSNLSALQLSSVSNDFKQSCHLTVTYTGVTSYTGSRPFNNWQCSADSQYYSPGDMYYLNSGCTMTAQWGSMPFTPPQLPATAFRVTYNYNGGSGSPAYTDLPRPAYGYSTSASGAVTYYAGRQYSTSSALTLYPIYGNAILEYAKLPKPTRAGYQFNGWYLNGTKVTSNLSITGAITLVANWTAVPIHRFTPDGRWENISAFVNIFKSDGQWHKEAPVYIFGEDGQWHNISQ